jgi:hypothetical protein
MEQKREGRRLKNNNSAASTSPGALHTKVEITKPSIAATIARHAARPSLISQIMLIDNNWQY